MEERVEELERKVAVLESMIVNKFDIDVKKYKKILGFCENCQMQGDYKPSNCETCESKKYFESITA